MWPEPFCYEKTPLDFLPLKNLSIARTDLIRFMDGYVSSMKPEKTSGILHSKIHSTKQNRWDLCSKSFVPNYNRIINVNSN